MGKRRTAKAKVSINVDTHEAISTPNEPIYPQATYTMPRDFQIIEPNKGGRPKGTGITADELPQYLPHLAEAKQMKAQRGKISEWCKTHIWPDGRTVARTTVLDWLKRYADELARYEQAKN